MKCILKEAVEHEIQFSCQLISCTMCSEDKSLSLVYCLAVCTDLQLL